MTFVLQALNGHFPAEGLVMFGYKENSEVPLNKPGLLWVMALIPYENCDPVGRLVPTLEVLLTSQK